MRRDLAAPTFAVRCRLLQICSELVCQLIYKGRHPHARLVLKGCQSKVIQNKYQTTAVSNGRTSHFHLPPLKPLKPNLGRLNLGRLNFMPCNHFTGAGGDASEGLGLGEGPQPALERRTAAAAPSNLLNSGFHLELVATVAVVHAVVHAAAVVRVVVPAHHGCAPGARQGLGGSLSSVCGFSNDV